MTLAAEADQRLDAPPPQAGRSITSVALLTVLAAVTTSICFQAFASALRRQGNESGLLAYWIAHLLLVGVIGWVVLHLRLDVRTRRVIAVVGIVVPGILYRLAEPLLLTGYDEQLHARALADLVASQHLLSPNPMLPISSYFPGLEVLTATLHDALGLPPMVAATVVVLASRALLGLALFEGARTVGCSARTASLVVLLYGACPQYYFFNSQFAYQTLAIGLGVSGLVLLRMAQSQPAGPARTRWIVGAVATIAACGVTHHITAWFVTAFALACWLVAPHGEERRVARIGALATVAVVGAWTGAVIQGLYSYLAPVATEAGLQLVAFARGEQQRELFQDSSGVQNPLWQRGTLMLYAAVAAFCAVAAGGWLLHRAWRTRSISTALLALICLVYPLTLASRIAPTTAELGDRSSTFVFFAWALVVAMAAVELEVRLRSRWPGRLVSAALVAVLALLVVGGNLLGSGPDWEKLPGSWLAAAENRSLDSETLAAARWSDAKLPAGSRMVADRMPSTLLASDAQLWPVTLPNSGYDVASLYFADVWGVAQSDLVREARLSYLYVDRRLSTQLPHVGSYFYGGESQGTQQLTLPQLTKFDTVQGLSVVYAHGPVRIYAIDPLFFAFETEVTGQRSRTDPPATLLEGLAGLLLGLALAVWLRRRPPASPSKPQEGTALLRCATTMAAVLLLGTAAYAVGQPVTWLFLLGLALPQVLWVGRLLPLRSPVSRQALTSPTAVFIGLCLATCALWAGNSIASSYDANVVQVERILNEVERSAP